MSLCVCVYLHIYYIHAHKQYTHAYQLYTTYFHKYNICAIYICRVAVYLYIMDLSILVARGTIGFEELLVHCRIKFHRRNHFNKIAPPPVARIASKAGSHTGGSVVAPITQCTGGKIIFGGASRMEEGAHRPGPMAVLLFSVPHRFRGVSPSFK